MVLETPFLEDLPPAQMKKKKAKMLLMPRYRVSHHLCLWKVKRGVISRESQFGKSTKEQDREIVFGVVVFEVFLTTALKSSK